MSLVKILINWLAFLTVPLWGGFFILALAAGNLASGDGEAQQLLSGRKWFWE